MLTTILVATLFVTGGGLSILGLVFGAVAAAQWDYVLRRTQTNLSRVLLGSGLLLLGVAVIWGIAAQAF